MVIKKRMIPFNLVQEITVSNGNSTTIRNEMQELGTTLRPGRHRRKYRETAYFKHRPGSHRVFQQPDSGGEVISLFAVIDSCTTFQDLDGVLVTAFPDDILSNPVV
jgi:hypothetical protein